MKSGAIAILIIAILGIIIYVQNRSSENQNGNLSPQSVIPELVNNSGCPNLYKDNENKFSFCLPANYKQFPNDKKSKTDLRYTTASFGPAQYTSYAQADVFDGSYVYVYFFNYTIGNTETPPNPNESAVISFANQTFQTDGGEIMKLYHPFSPSSTDNIYSYKLKNGKYIYFDFFSSHRLDPTEFNNHIKILKSVRQI